MLMVLQDEDVEKQNVALHLVSKLTKPTHLSEDDIVNTHIQQV